MNVRSRTLLVAGLLAMAVIASCTSYASKEDLQQLEESKAKSQSMQGQVTQLTNDRKKADQDLQQKKQKLDQVRKEKDDVLKRLLEIEKAGK